jgi:hypothetical protein
MQLPERRVRRCGIGHAAARRIVVRVAGTHRLPPEILEAIGSERGEADRVLNVHVAKPGLDRAGVVTGVGERVAVPEHVRVDGERKIGAPTDRLDLAVDRVRPLGRENVAGSGVLPRRSLGSAFIFFVLTRA